MAEDQPGSIPPQQIWRSRKFPPPWPFGKELFDVVSYKNDFAVFCLSIFIMYSIY